MWGLNAFVKAGCAVAATCAVSTAMARVKRTSAAADV